MVRDLIERLANRVLAWDADTAARLARLHDKVICVHCTAPDVRFYLLPTSAGIRVESQCARAPDVTLRGSAHDFLRLALADDDAIAAARALEVEGDIALGQELQRIVHRLDIDWEEPLSRVVGDVAAHELARGVRAGNAWLRAAGATLAADLGEFLQYERRVVASREELAAFVQAVDILRADTDRLQQRIELLARAQTSS